ncbi:MULTISPECIES: hypothetical protein [unclassified Streptomyces]|uniref:hypothetical protein n=1 Tax=unclassified Streptomyces TaxID=2593676 RepID=UPI002251D116|nr:MULTISPECIES: hypothetical protein [unclassified Streptomyces]MCX4788167.1 hypothetical protein [Streptomyces sp. NBC_01221]WSP63734.1 hypothetical protein OG466_18895 [Streptomyces sp. NBC_01240]WSU22850.1 hypothetical protein OG508_18995 [Streptomyces sp. NBC_01108]
MALMTGGAGSGGVEEPCGAAVVVGDDHHGGRGGTWLPFRTRRAGVTSARHGAWLGLVLDGPGTPVKVVEYAPEGVAR